MEPGINNRDFLIKGFYFCKRKNPKKFWLIGENILKVTNISLPPNPPAGKIITCEAQFLSCTDFFTRYISISARAINSSTVQGFSGSKLAMPTLTAS